MTAPRPVALYAHRGDTTAAEDNSLAAVQALQDRLRRGAGERLMGIEGDVRQMACGTYVMSHYHHHDGVALAGSRWRDLSPSSRPPTLVEYLAATEGIPLRNLEIKHLDGDHAAHARSLVRLVGRSTAVDGIRFSTFSPAMALALARAARPARIPVGLLTKSPWALPDDPRATIARLRGSRAEHADEPHHAAAVVALADAIGVDQLIPRFTMVGPSLLAALRETNLRRAAGGKDPITVTTWTVNDASVVAELERSCAGLLDGVITDFVDIDPHMRAAGTGRPSRKETTPMSPRARRDHALDRADLRRWASGRQPGSNVALELWPDAVAITSARDRGTGAEPIGIELTFG